jgi:hypothetical protein
MPISSNLSEKQNSNPKIMCVSKVSLFVLFGKLQTGNDCLVSDMHEEAADCSELIMQTADAIDDDTLKLLFVSVQQNNMEICIYYALVWVAIHFP